MGDNSIQEAIGQGCIDISMTIKKNVLPKMLTNILRVPKIVKKLFSFNKATSYGHIFKFGNKECIIKNMHKEVVRQGMRENQLYKLQWSTKLNIEECVQVGGFCNKLNTK